MENVRRLSCDVLIIGGGSAGLRAAIEAYDNGSSVLIVSKSKRGNAHTVLATGGINAALGTMDPEDSWMIHAADTLREGRFIADYKMVEILCKNGPDTIKELVKWGARFHRENDGRLTQRFFGAHTYRRTCFYGDQTGKEIIRVLMNQVRKRKIKIIDNVYIAKILKKDGKAKGALGIDFKNRRVVILQFKCVVLAGGGYSRLYHISSSRNFENYGEGVMLAYDAGADLVDMEMVQFHPTGMVWPKKSLGTLVTEAVRGEGGVLINSKSERFMEKYDPERMELGPRDEVARAIYNEIYEGRGTKHGGVWLSITHVPKEKIIKRLPKMYKQFKELAGIDISKEKMEVAPTAHYSMGGVKVDYKGMTNVKGLFAVGEVTGQLHGANRLGGNSLLETIVFGKIVGRNAALFSRKNKISEVSTYDALKELVWIRNPDKMRDEIQKTMWENVGLIRNAKKLRKALKKILSFKKVISKSKIRKLKIDKKLIKSLDVKSMVFLSEAVVRSALTRRESRGAHFRSDFPKQDDAKWNVNIYCRKSGNRIKIFKRRVAPLKGKLKNMLLKQSAAYHHLLE